MNLINTKDTMVSVIDYRTVKTEAGKEFNLLVVQGGVQPLVSAKTGRIYLTMRKANVSTTFADASCKSLIGTELRGSIKKVSCDPYDYTIKDKGEVIVLTHRFDYVEEEKATAPKVEKSETTVDEFMSNSPGGVSFVSNGQL